MLQRSILMTDIGEIDKRILQYCCMCFGLGIYLLVYAWGVSGRISLRNLWYLLPDRGARHLEERDGEVS